MDPNARRPRPDVTYISRRIRPKSTHSGTDSNHVQEASLANHTDRPLSAAPSSGLSLERPRSGSGPSAERGARPPLLAPVPDSARLFSAPGFTETRQLAEGAPIVRLNARQSGIGTLLVHGARSIAWEDTDQVTGAENVQGERAGVASTTVGNRNLVGFHGGSAAIALRHVRRLRRAIFVAQEEPLVVSLFGESALAVSPKASDGKSAVLYIAHIDSLLELRAEYVESVNDEAIWAAFGFTMTTPTFVHTGRH
jgi:hypothetical protein